MKRHLRLVPRAPEVDAAVARGEITREQAQGRGVRGRGKKTIGIRALERTKLRALPVVTDRPRTRGDCENAVRPCGFVSCAWHLYLDVSPTTGALTLNFPDVAPEDLGGQLAEVLET